ncbi:MAG: epoxyqueuosine reductase QueH [Simkania sp.]|nr:epoxyqueuosine reductase QueH [Simkania sp.]
MPDFVRPLLQAPNNEKKILLHSCCAPCSGDVIEAMVASGLDITIFFYNPNIHPKKEYEMRKSENRRYADKFNIPCVDADYDPKNWFERAQGLEYEQERGKRCTMCFDMRFARTALYASENHFKVFTSSLGISLWKDIDQINDCGVRAAAPYENLTYWTYDWKQDGGSSRMYEIAKRERLYKQEYCGCAYSLRDTNAWRAQNNMGKIEICRNFFSPEDTVEDESEEAVTNFFKFYPDSKEAENRQNS